MKKLICLGLALLLLGGWATSSSAQREEMFRKLMVEKLKSSQQLLEGLVTQNFAKITDSGERLLAISNQAEWFAFETPSYKLHTNEFRRAAETVIQKSKAKNIDGVALAYVDLTLTCVRCHQHVRELREARLDDLSPLQFARRLEP